MSTVSFPGGPPAMAIRLVHQAGDDVIVGDDPPRWRGKEARTHAAQGDGTGLAHLDADDCGRELPECLGDITARRRGDDRILGVNCLGAQGKESARCRDAHAQVHDMWAGMPEESVSARASGGG
jgi:hypothetical protein